MANKLRVHSDKSNASALSIKQESGDIQYFWSIVLSAEKRSITWVASDVDTIGDDDLERTLVLKTAVLGSNAISGEQNVVTFQSAGEDGKVQKGVIINLTRGLNPMSPLNLNVAGRIGGTFTLSEGTGPITISGTLIVEFRDDYDVNDETQTDMDDSDDEDDETGEDEPTEEIKQKTKANLKRKASPAATKQKKGKMDVNKSEQDEDDDDDSDDDVFIEDEDDDDDDEDYVDVKTKKTKKEKVDVKKPEKGKPKLDKDSGKKAKTGKK